MQKNIPPRRCEFAYIQKWSTLGGMKSFVASYNHGIAEGLAWPRSKEEQEGNAHILQERLASNWQQLEAAKILDGLIIHSRQQVTGSLCVSGPQEKIDRLKAFLEENNLGSVLPNEVMIQGAEVA